MVFLNYYTQNKKWENIRGTENIEKFKNHLTDILVWSRALLETYLSGRAKFSTSPLALHKNFELIIAARVRSIS